MSQYDLKLIQNIAAEGVDFEEKTINIDKGGLLSAIATTKVPTVLAAGTNGYILKRDDNEVTGLKWVAESTHTQNTDTGTTGNTFTIDSDSATGKIILDVALGAADKSLTITNQALTDDIVITLPNVTSELATVAAMNGLIAAADAMVYKGTVGTGGTIEKAALEALSTYNAGWTYRVITAGTYFSVVCEVGDLITCIVDRAGSGDVDTDWAVIQTNLDGAVIGPASVTDGVHALFDGTTGKLIKAGSTPHAAVTVDTAGGVAGLSIVSGQELTLTTASTNTHGVLTDTDWNTFNGKRKALVSAPASKTASGAAGDEAYDANYYYQCVATDTWRRTALAQWS